jgi:hypothetical protein
MGVETAILVGGGLQLYGQITANKAQAKAEKANARYYAEQKAHALIEKRRAMDIYKTQSEDFLGEKVSLIAKSGVSLSGSVLMELAKDKSAAKRETFAIETQADVNAKLAQLRANQANSTAKTLSSTQYNLTQSAGTILNAYTTSQMLKKN